MDGTFIFIPYVSTYVIVKSTPVTHYLQKDDRKITGYDSYGCLMSTHKVIAVIIMCVTFVKKVKREGREEGREWLEKPSHTFDLNEAGYEYT